MTHSIWIMHDNHTFRQLKGDQSDLLMIREYWEPYLLIFSRGYVVECDLSAHGRTDPTPLVAEYEAWLDKAVTSDSLVAQTLGI